MAKGRALPKWLEEEPLPCVGDDFYMRSFWDLCTERQYGMGPGPIPRSKMVEYGQQAGLDEVMLEAFCAIMRAMDAVWMDWQGKEAEKQRNRK